jgi:hypothetical protein
MDSAYNSVQYSNDLQAIFSTYLESKNGMYEGERRWLAENFWKNAVV